MNATIPLLAGALPGSLAPPGVPASAPAGQQCFSGTVQRRPEVGIPFAGTHLLTGPGGNVVASLVSSQINLETLVGQNVTVCGFGQGLIEGVPAVAVIQAQPVAAPVHQPRLTSLFACTVGILGQPPLFFAASPVNATLRTGSGDLLLIVQGAAPEALSSLFGQTVLACGFLTMNNELFTAAVVPISQVIGSGLSC